jgi:cysteine synthase
MKTTRFQNRLFQLERENSLSDSDLVGLERGEIYSRLGSLIGNTRRRLYMFGRNNLLIQKDETANPTESHYDRCYFRLLKSLEEEGTITPGDTLLEVSTGSAGISFAWMAKKLGYDAVVFMPSYVPKPRIVEVRNLAKEVILADNKELYVKECADMMMEYFMAHRARVKAAGRKIYMPNHSRDERSPLAFEEIVDEIIPNTSEVGLDYFVGGIGNGSTLLGIGRRAKELFPHLRVVGVEPASSCHYFERDRARWCKVVPKSIMDVDPDDVQRFDHEYTGTGVGAAMDFPFNEEALSSGVVDDICLVPPISELPVARYHERGGSSAWRLGHSSLAAMFVVERIAEEVSWKTFLSLVYDRMDRYGEVEYV